MRARTAPAALSLVIATTLSGQYSDVTVSPSQGKPGQQLNIVISSQTCANSTANPKPLIDPDGAIVSGTGATLTLNGAPGCLLQGTLKLASDVSPGVAQIVVHIKNGDQKTPVPLAFTIQDPMAGPVPPGMKPEVDVQWDVLPESVVEDNFGKRIARSFYAIEIAIGNDSGYALQIASVGFEPDPLQSVSQNVLPNESYVTVRGVLEQEQVWGSRNLTARGLDGGGTIVAALEPFFHHTSHALNYSTAVSVFAGPFTEAFKAIFPDDIITRLKRVDDYSLRDGLVIANNTHIRTLVFFQKDMLQRLVDLRKRTLNPSDALRAAQQIGSQIADHLTTLQQSRGGQPTVLSDPIKAASNLANSSSYSDALSNATTLMAFLQSLKNDLHDAAIQQQLVALQLQADNLKLAGLWGTGTGASGKKAPQLLDPLLVRQALSRLVLIGNEIKFVNRIRVDNNAPQVGVTPPPIIDMTKLPTLQVTGKSLPVTLYGEHLDGASVTSSDASIDTVHVDPNGKTVSFNVTVKDNFQGDHVTVNVSTPAPGTNTVAVPIPFKKAAGNSGAPPTPHEAIQQNPAINTPAPPKTAHSGGNSKQPTWKP
jgi:hypothetical protein